MTFDAESWQRRGYEDFSSMILARDHNSKTFPCVYATLGYKANQHYYCFLESEAISDPVNTRLIANYLTQYLSIARSSGPNTSLVIMCRSTQIESEGSKTIQDYLYSFWACLKALRDQDTHDWPTEYPKDTESERWCFCFNSIPLFIVGMTPAHQKRRSRHAPNFCLVIQPKWLFDALFSTQAKREAACRKVRGLVEKYDEIPLSPDVSDYGKRGTSEARQYFLLDDNVPSICPYRKLSD